MATLTLGLLASAASADDLAPFAVDVKEWPRQSVAEVGCALEKLGHRDPVFNCSLVNYKSDNDPCDGPRYYEGPVFPEALLPRVHPRATRLDLSFEHGKLQMMSLTLEGDHTPAQVWTALGMAGRTEEQFHTERVMTWSVESGAGKTYATAIGFDHMGAGDVDCSKGKK